MFFQVSITPKAKEPAEPTKDVQEPPPTLILAPFQPQVHINLKTKINSGSEEQLGLTWTPREAGSWRDTLQFCDNRRIKYDVTLTTTSLETNKKGLTKVSDNNLRNKSQTTVKSNVNLNFDDFQLTPLKPPAALRTKIPEIQIEDHTLVAVGLRSSSNVPDIHVFEPTDVEFSPRDSRISSPINDGPHLRRETYSNPQPKFTERMIVIDQDSTECQEETFEDSLSPPHCQEPNNGPHNFSTIIDNINFITPVKIKSPDNYSPSSNGTEYFSIQSNHSFSISEKGSLNSYKLNSTYELLPSPGNNNESIQLTHQSELRSVQASNNSDDKTLNVKNSTITSGEFKKNSSSSPVFFDQSRLSLSQSLRNGDNASAKDVLEADLWVRDNQSQNYIFSTPSHHISSSKSNLEKINEESYLCKTQTYRLAKPKFVHPPLNESSSTDQVEARCIEISPPRRLRWSELMKKPSPIKHNKIMKDKVTQSSLLNKKKVQYSVRKGNLSIPGVRMSSLSLSGLKSVSNTTSTNKPIKAKDKTAVKIFSPDNIIAQVYNPYVTMKNDPFLSMSLYYDENFLVKQEQEYTKWLNRLMTPPEQLDTDVEEAPIDVGKIWQSCRSKENVLAETKEKVSARYHTNTRLNSLRKAAAAMLRNGEVTSVLANVTACINKGMFIIRQDRDLHRDIGLQKEILQLFLSYNPLWLRIGLEVIYNEQINLHSNSDIIGLTKFIMMRFFTDPYLVKTYSLQNVTSLRAPEFQGHMNKFMLKKFFFLVYFLDYIKRNKLIGYDPCLFLKKASYKDSREILLTFSRHLLSGVGDITKILRSHGYIVTHKQNYIDEFDYAVKDIAVDLRDGVRLCRVMELIKGDKTLTERCRVPAISRLQKVFNVELALTALLQAGYTLAGDIDAKSIADGHREKTLSLLWQIIYKFQAPRYEKASITIQTWWKTKLWYIRVKRYLSNRKNNAAMVIQRTWRCYCARKLLKKLREQRAIFLAQLDNSTRFVQRCWLRKKQMLKDRRDFLDKKAAVVCIQRWFRRIRSTRPYLEDLQRKREAVIKIQIQWRAVVIMRRERNNYLRIKQAAIITQQWWRAVSLKSSTCNYYKNLKAATVFVQSKWRAKKLMIEERTRYFKIIRAAVKIQTWWRSYLIGKRVRNDYLLKKDAVRVIESWLVACKSRDTQVEQYLAVKKSAAVIKKAWKRYYETKNYVKRFKLYCRAARTIQSWWRMVRVAREYRLQKKSAIICQRYWRGLLITRGAREKFLAVKKSAILVQKIWKMKKQRRNYLKIKSAVIKIEGWYSNAKYSKNVRREFVRQKEAAKFIQSWWRCLKMTKKCQAKYSAERKAAIVIQRFWRAKVIGKFPRLNYLKMRSSAIKIQAFWRMVLARRKYLDDLKRNKAAVVIQRRWRAKVVGIKIREAFIRQKNAAIVVQRRYRAVKIAREVKMQFEAYKKAAIIIQKNWRKVRAFRKFKRQRNAAIVLQSHWRARVIGKKTRENYLKQRSAVITLQRRYRALKLGRVVRNQFVIYQKAAVIIQKNLRMFKLSQDYQQLRTAAIVLQCQWRARKLSLEASQKYQLMKKAAIVIQQRYRACKLGSKVRNEYLEMRNSAIKVQTLWRANKLMKQARREFLCYRQAAVCLQSTWKMIVVRREYLRKKQAVNKIKIAWRQFVIARNIRNKFLALRSAALFVQRRYRNCIKIRRNFIKLKSAVVIVQRSWRLKLQLRKNVGDIEKERRLNRAAVIIQSTYRGYIVRKNQSEEERKIRERVHQASQKADESNILANRLQNAIYTLQNASNVGQLSMCLGCIDTITRLSPKGCRIFCELKLIDAIYNLLGNSNRSLPWMDVCLRCSSILVTIIKLKPLSAYVRNINETETIARLMNAMVKANSELFLHLATLFWLLSRDEDFVEQIKQSPRIIWLIRTMIETHLKKNTGNVNKNKSLSLQDVIVPNEKPDWVRNHKRPRYFTNVSHALISLNKIFNIVP
ncbi:Similar to asp: Protein abnormal spindle (Drosophila melanogaster) [Cotesia congregata]|uniref:Similar to asp: Protein abnormal spindle (Drosophila melanogaster) n=1 Tax=Cotesia congregata TaxID=51543 RepID=A0A8J2HDY8_COTCN|nr:Similar to asp: Protein abnormal spindle (Drosophila melanogaster) [Cotesia congregata]